MEDVSAEASARGISISSEYVWRGQCCGSCFAILWGTLGTKSKVVLEIVVAEDMLWGFAGVALGSSDGLTAVRSVVIWVVAGAEVC